MSCVHLLQLEIYEAVLVKNGINPAFIRGAEDEEQEDPGSDEDDDDVEVASVSSAVHNDARIPSQAGDAAPESSHRAEEEGKCFLATAL